MGSPTDQAPPASEASRTGEPGAASLRLLRRAGAGRAPGGARPRLRAAPDPASGPLRVLALLGGEGAAAAGPAPRLTPPGRSPSFPRHVFRRLPPRSRPCRRSPTRHGGLREAWSRSDSRARAGRTARTTGSSRSTSAARAAAARSSCSAPTTRASLPEKLVIKTERVADWQAHGAQLSPSVKSLMRRARRRQPAAGAR